MFVKRVHHPLVFFTKVGPKDQQYFHAVERSLRKQGACFLRSKKAEKSDVRQSIPRGDVVCIYGTLTKKGGQKFSGSSWEEVGGRKGEVLKRFCFSRGQNSSIILSELGLHPL